MFAQRFHIGRIRLDASATTLDQAMGFDAT